MTSLKPPRGRLWALQLLPAVFACSSEAACPNEPPAAGSACDADAACPFDDHLRVECRSTGVCRDGAWAIRQPECREPPAGFCAAAPAPGEACDLRLLGIEAAPDGSVDAPGGPSCPYQDGSLCYCRCSEPGGCDATTTTWTCADAPEPPCPAVAPSENAPCEDADLRCVYGLQCEQSNVKMLCDGDVWTRLSVTCPN